MAQPLAPCGTFTAYKRHTRNDEDIDEACAQAARDQANNRNAAKREAVSAEVRSVLSMAPLLDEDTDVINELTEAYDTLQWIKTVMNSGVTQGAAALAKQRLEIVSLIKRLESADKPKESKLDELAKRRAERLAASSN